MTRRTPLARSEEAFQAILDGSSTAASPEILTLSKIASALEPATRPGPDPRFSTRLRSALLAEASADEDLFATIMDGARTDAPAEVMVLARVASALEPATLPAPPPEFRFRLRNRLMTEAARPQGVLQGRMAAVGARVQRMRRRVAAIGLAAMMMLGSSAALAMAQDDLPGDGLYGLKLAHEDAQLWAASGAAEGYRSIGFAKRRISEVRGLTARGESDHRLYIDALNRMDELTLEGTDLLVVAFQAGEVPGAMDQIQTFAAQQAGALEDLVDLLPPAARPVAEDSIVVAETVADRAARVECGCVPGQEPSAIATPDGEDPTSGDEGAVCACEPVAPTSGTGDGDAPGEEPGREPGPGGNGNDDEDDDDGDDGDGDGDGDNDPDEPAVDLPDVPGSDTDEQVEDAVNEVIDDLVDEITTPTPGPLPTLP